MHGLTLGLAATGLVLACAPAVEGDDESEGGGASDTTANDDPAVHLEVVKHELQCWEEPAGWHMLSLLTLEASATEPMTVTLQWTGIAIDGVEQNFWGSAPFEVDLPTAPPRLVQLDESVQQCGPTTDAEREGTFTIFVDDEEYMVDGPSLHMGPP